MSNERRSFIKIFFNRHLTTTLNQIVYTKILFVLNHLIVVTMLMCTEHTGDLTCITIKKFFSLLQKFFCLACLLQATTNNFVRSSVCQTNMIVRAWFLSKII